MQKLVTVKNSVVELLSVGVFGAMSGAVIFAFLADRIASTAEYATLLSGFGGAVLGSGMSAFVALVLARQTSKETLDRDIRARNAEQQSYALRLMVKASLILSDVVAIQRSIDSSLSDANDRNLTSQPLWKRILPIVGSYQLYDVDAAELSPLIAAKNSGLMQSAVTLFMQHRNLIEVVKVYSEKRDLVKSYITHHITAADGVITSGLTEADVSRLAPLEMELESLAKGIREMIPNLISLGEQVTYGIGPAMRKFYENSEFPVFAPIAPSGQPADPPTATAAVAD
ncbi:hypothetical protein DBIPINDM_006821 [Mesorhizobium sp. AR02]|uniref:hypothetical protein n=1 Tax=Mesorhizobium sp. AR02 TaxID=2865837 RepID=UPI002160593B|nr:hypothetical protein [Mesorhizobium sp. AR02]UVK53338.1 hypothetical protein DBIPINDM_006821 [Mesorhizobium sp. AR02]